MKRTEVVALLNQLEQRHPVNTWTVDGAHVWPLIRQRIGAALIKYQFPEEGSSDKGPAQAAKHMGFLLRGAWQWLVGLPRLGGNIVLLSENGHRVIHDGRVHDKFSDPLASAAVTLGHRAHVLEHLNGQRISGPRALRIRRTDISPAQALHAYLHWRRSRPAYAFFPELEKLLADVPAHLHRPGLDEFSAALFTFQQHLRFHRRFFAGEPPKAVFLVCWYSAESMALSHLCAQHGRPCIDLQHGVQGAGHIAYGTWAAIPPGGYTTMPRVFWCWDQQSADHIDQWATLGHRKALVLGDPWLETMAARATPLKRTDGTRTVLFTTYPPELLPRIVLDAMRTESPPVHWIIRAHPNRPGDAHEVRRLLEAEGLAHRATVTTAAEVPLAEQLLACDVLITDYSSVILEAARLNVLSLSWDDRARDLFAPQLADGRLHMVGTAAEMMSAIVAARSSAPAAQPLPDTAQRLARVLEAGSAIRRALAKNRSVDPAI